MFDSSLPGAVIQTGNRPSARGGGADGDPPPLSRYKTHSHSHVLASPNNHYRVGDSMGMATGRCCGREERERERTSLPTSSCLLLFPLLGGGVSCEQNTTRVKKKIHGKGSFILGRRLRPSRVLGSYDGRRGPLRPTTHPPCSRICTVPGTEHGHHSGNGCQLRSGWVGWGWEDY